ncbi:hypothetical protein [Aeromicrobium sp. 179-A 4D2 NHS]|uniref:hypothetical protein n=1 Tax=Aeromicrobium sp. 179-A 4D2 NHS TaxID=3142375 RepID=UPI0039A074E6
MSSSLNSWSWALMVVLGMLIAGALVGLGLSGALIVTDEADHGGDWDGFGTFLGALGAVLSLVVLAVAIVLFVLVRSARARANRSALAGIAGVCAVPSLFALLGAVFAIGSNGLLGTLVLAAPALLVAVPAVGTLVTVTREGAAGPSVPPDR